MSVSAVFGASPVYYATGADMSDAQIKTGVFVLSPREYLTLFITRGQGWTRFMRRYGLRVLLLGLLVGYLSESWRTGGRALVVLAALTLGVLVAGVIGGWLWIHRAASRGECVRFEPVYYTLNEQAVTLYWSGGRRSIVPLIRIKRMVRTPRYCLLHVERGLFHCVPVAAFGSEEAIRRCEEWMLAADVSVEYRR